MRALFLALCLCFAATPAYAQTDIKPEIQNAAPSPATVAAARDFMSLMLVESGAIDRALEQAAAQLIPIYSAQLQSSPFFANLSSERRDAVRGPGHGGGRPNDRERLRRARACAAETCCDGRVRYTR